VLLAGWIVHATILHFVYLGFPSWDAFGYRVPPIVELIQHGELGTERYNQWRCTASCRSPSWSTCRSSTCSG
jgi:hypothetical protein